ncbi:MAG: hypothetical protein ABMA02_02440 [Saprospiraceae bacterium]
MKNTILANGRLFVATFFGAICFIVGQASAQTTLISPTGDGGFENGSTFAANGWTLVNGATNQWFLGAVAPPSAGANCAYVSNDVAGATYNYDIVAASTVHFYRDITFPAGQTSITLTFKWKVQGESSYDYVTVFSMPTSNTPLPNSPAGGFQSWLNIPTAYPGAVIHCTPPNLNLQGTYQTQTICLPASYAGTTRRLVFMWTNDTSAGTQPPGSIDEISLVSAPGPATPANQPTALALTPGLTSIGGSFTAAAGAPSGYLVVRTPTSTPPSAPVDNTTYTAGQSALGGVIVASGAGTTFSSTGLTPNTTYHFWVYSFNSGTCGGPAYLTTAPLTGFTTTNNCSLSGTKSVGPTGDYMTLTAAVADLLASGVVSPIILELQSTYLSTAEPAFPIVLPNILCASSTNTITIRPALGATGLSISSAGTQTFDINGGNWWRIDGRPGGVGTAKDLVIANTSTSGNAIRFINEASNNIVRYCDIQGQNTSTTSAVVLFSTTTNTNGSGNDNNLIEFNNIHDTPTGTPSNCIYSLGTTTTGATWNSNNTVANNNIYNFFLSTSTSIGVFITTGSRAWTITGNSFFQTASRTLAAAQFGAMNFNNTITGDFVITNNFLGGTAPQCGGGAMTLTGSGNFRGMNFTVSGALTTVQGNTIKNINLTTLNATQFNGAILLGQGTFLCTDNTVGSLTENNSIALTFSGSASGFAGITSGGTSPTNTITISNNSIGGLSMIVSGAPATPPVLRPISVQGTSIYHNYVITGNTIGSLSLANNITSDANVAGSITGIVSFSNAVGQQIINNTIANLTASNINTTNVMWGILAQGSSNIGSFTITGNTIRNLSSASSATGTGGAASIMGISTTVNLATVGANNISNNTIHSLVNTNTTAAASVTGINNSVSLTTSNLLSRNNIHSLNLQSTALTGIITGIQLNAGTANVQNNMIRLGVDAAGTDISNGYGFFGIREAAGNNNVQFNSVYIGGSGVSNGTSATFALSSAVTTGTRNYISNIFHNARSNGAGTGKHYAITFGGTTPSPAGVASNYNDLFVSGTGGFVGLYNAVDQTTIADWRTATGNDVQSVNANPQFIAPNGNSNTGDLHIQAGVPTVVEGGGQPVAATTDDFDGQTRNSFTATDIGADAGNFMVADASGPGIAYTPLASVCGTVNVALSNVNITDATGIPTAGALIPRVYYRKGAGGWFSNAGTLASGNGNNGVWNFTMLAADMGGLASGDIVSYYVIAQDNTGRIGSNAGGAIATDVNNVTTHPGLPNTATVQSALSGTYTVGVGGNYTTLTAAVADYNAKCIGGPVVFSLIDATYPSETYPITINAINGASNVNTLTIRPAAGNTATISGASPTASALIRLNGADWVILDGSNSGGTDRSLTLNNTSTLTSTAVIWLSSVSAINGATNNTIKNLNIAAGSNTVTSTFGIHVSGATLSTTGTGENNDNVVIQNNAISKAYWGIYARSSTFGGANDGLQIIGNSIGGALVADYVMFRGMDIYYANAPLISQNTIFNMDASTLSASIAGIEIGTGVTNAQVLRNNLTGIKNTNSGGWGSYGIFLSTTTGITGTLIANNFISDMLGANYVSGTTFHSYGIRLSGGYNTKVYNNSVNFFGSVTSGATASISANMIISTTLAQGTEVRNNIFRNTHDFTAAGSNIYNLYMPTGVQLAASDNNDFYGQSTATTTSHVGFNGGNLTTLDTWRQATGQDAASFYAQPIFTSNTDLHLSSTANFCLDGGGTPLAAVGVDYDNQARNASTPDIGADEFSLTNLNISATENSGTTPNDNTTCNGDPVTLTANATGTSYAWSSGGSGNPLVVNPTTTTTYTCTVTDASGCTEVLAPITITVNPLPTVFSVTGGGAYCSPGAGVPVGLDGSQSGVNYQLKRNNVNVGAPVAGTGAAISFGNQTAAGTYTVTANGATTNCSNNMTGSAVVVENPTPTAFNMTGGGAYCSPGAGVPVGLSGSQSGVNYQLLRGGVNVGAPVAGTGNALAFGNQTVAGSYTVVATHTNGGCTANMNGTAVVVANPKPTLTETHVEPTTCVSTNGSINLAVSSGTSPYSYNWATANGTGLTPGQEDQNNLTVGLYNVTVTDVNACSATMAVTLIGPGNCDACPIIGSMTAVPNGVCAGAPVVLTAAGLVDMGTTYGITFKYFAAPTATPYTGGTVIATVPNSGLGNNGTTATTTTSFAVGGVYHIYAILDQLPTDPTCRPSKTVALTVVNIPSVNPVNNQTVCAGSNTAPVNFSGPISGTIFNWTNNNTSIGLAASGTGNIPAFAAQNATGAPVTATITVTPVTSPSTGAQCTGPSITFSITVNPIPNVTAVANQTYCNGSSVLSIVFTGNVPGAVYSWSRTATSIGLAPTSGTNTVPAFTATNATTLPVTSTFTVVASFTNNGVTCTGTPIQFSITVNPTPTVSATPLAQTICNGVNTTAINFTGTVTGTVFNWTNNNTSIGLAASGTGNIPSFAAVNTGGAPQVATVTVTPTYTNNGVTCSGTPVSVTITVNPRAQVNQPANISTCSGSPVSVTFTTTTPGTTYSWTNTTPAIGLASSGTGNISFTAATVGAATTGTITVTPNYTNNGVSCPGTAVTFTITVNPNPTVNPVANQPVICSGDATNPVLFSGAFPGTVYNWTNSNTSIGLAASGTGDIPSFTTVNTGTTIQTATITVTPSLTTGTTTCTGNSITFTYTVYPRPQVNTGADITICQDQNATLSVVLGGGATSGFWNGGAGQFVPPNTTTTTYIPAASEYGTTVTLRFTSNDPSGPCPSVSDTILLTVNKLPIVFAGNDVKICPGATLDLAKLAATITDNGSGVTTGVWSSSGTGTFQPNNSFPPGATSYVPSAADYIAGFVTLTLTSADPDGPCNSVSDQVRLGFKKSGAPVCNDNVQVSLDSTGVGYVEPDMVMEGTYEYEFYTVSIMENGLSIGDSVTCAHVGKTFTIKITDICTGNICWGSIKVEDKLPPKMTCNNYNLVCVVENYDPNYILNTLGVQNAVPTVVENCPPATLEHVDDFTDLDCTQSFSARLRRTWTATDASGNKSSCIQTINFERRGIANVLFPADVTISCNANGVNTTPAATGAPYFTAFNQNWPILPTVGACEIQSAHVDQVLPVCDGTYKILRTWTVYDWCLPTKPTPPNQNPLYFIQVIKVDDLTGPAFTCPANITVGTDATACCASTDLPDMIVEDACSRINSATARIVVRDPVTNMVIVTHDFDGSIQDFSGNNHWDPDTLVAYGLTECLPLGAHTVTYSVKDDCDNIRTCTFRVTVDDRTPPVAACDDFTNVSLGVSGEAFVNAATFDDGSYDNCGTVSFKARRMASNSCQSSSQFYDQVKFCCEDIGDTIVVVFRVYDIIAQTGDVSLTYEEPNSNDCMVRVFVEDKIKPYCKPPAHVTVSCEGFDPSLWPYGYATAEDNCCVDTVTESRNLSLFDTVCNRGTIMRTFIAHDCGGQSATCTQRVVVNYNQNYFLRLPNDVIVTTCDGTGNYGEPAFFGKDCELLGVSHLDEIFTVVPDACFKIERTWTIVNWCTYDPNIGCTEVPNPNPNPATNHASNLPGPTVSPAGTPAPWTPTVVAILPGQTPTNYSTFWKANTNCYRYKQIIKIIDTQKPVIENCPASPQEVCDITANAGDLWNAMYWWDNTTGSHDLCEGPTDLSITATDLCSNENVNIRYQLFLDLDGDGVMETIINSNQTGLGGLGWNNVPFGNAGGGSGSPREFDHRPVPSNQKYGFALQTTISGTKKSASVRWNTQQAQSTFVTPELPYGVHKIKWLVEDGCGNEQFCEYIFEVKDCKKPTVICVNGLSVNIMPTKMIALGVNDFLLSTSDNCTPANKLVTAIRRAGAGTGFPLNPDGTPQKTVTFTCADLGKQNVEVWSRDLAGNADFCITFVDVQDNMNNCSSTHATVAGALKTESSNGLEDASVSVGNATAQSDASGMYLTSGLPYGNDYTVTPLKDNDPLNGVSTFDLVLINKHILGLDPLNSPYKMIAADANNSRSITTFDIVELRKLILGIYTELPNNTSWRFVDQTFGFPNPANPFQTIFPETKQYAGLQSNIFDADFFAVKVGDVNGNAVTSTLMSTEDRTAGTLLFDVQDRTVKAGETFTVNFKAAEKVQGYQFTLNHTGLEQVDVKPGTNMSLANFGVFADDKALTTSWDGDVQGEFALTFRATASGELSRMLGVSGRITKAEAYNAGAERLQVGFRFNGANGQTITGLGFELYQNSPNPFVSKTQIGFHLPEAATATLTIFDETGRMLFTQRGDFGKGYNAVTVDRAVLNATGVLYYTLETAKESATRKMIQSK